LFTAFSEHGTLETRAISPWRNGSAGPTPKARSNSNGSSRNGHLPDSAKEAETHAAIGSALANKTRKNGKIAVVFGGDFQVELWNEALEIAGLHGLPMIFVTQEDPKAGKARPPAKAVRSNGSKQESSSFPIMTVDRADVVAVYRVANEAIARARQGRGPTLIACQPFRLQGRSRANTNGNGRHFHDPILNMELYLRGKGLFRRNLKDDLVAEFSRELASDSSSDHLARGWVWS
jgi:TPP-dependent pyruvate/acetoin dehydrogenase alpha subunit